MAGKDDPPPKLLSQKTAREYAESKGYTATKGGKHVVKMEKKGHRPVTLPKHRGQDYSKGLSDAIRKQIDSA
jgi:hypothetical protein